MPLAVNFVTVTVNLPGVGVTTQSFNTGLIVGTSTIITATERLRLYTSLAQMLTDGFANNSPEYLAAQFYFGQNPQPTQLYVGRRDLTASETSLAALQACRAASGGWYMAYDTSAVDSDQTANAAYFETLTAPFSQYIVQSSTAAIRSGTAGNLFLNLQAANYKRTSGFFSSTAYAAASVMGYAMGQTSNNVNSNYTLKFKQLPGVTDENLTETQVSAIENANGNVYVNRGGARQYEQGVTFSGQFFDQVIGRDILLNSMGVNVQNILLSVPSAPQTESGVSLLKAGVVQACNDAVARGFLAEGTWTQAPVLGIETGQILPNGFAVVSSPISAQSASDRAARKAPPIYACTKEAGAIHSTAIQVNVNI